MEYRLAKTYEEKGYKVIKVYNQNGKMMADCKIDCPRCGGKGEIPYYGHVDNGVCFYCRGAGKFYETVRAYTEDERAKLDAAAERKRIKKEEELKANSEKNKKEYMEKYGYGDGNIFIPAGFNTYEYKDILKNAGARYDASLGWFFNTNTKPEDLPLPPTAFFYHCTFDGIYNWDYRNKKPYFKDNALIEIKNDIAETISKTNASTSKSQHYGTIGDRIRKVEATLESIKYIEGEWGGSILYTFKIGDNIFTWFTQSSIDNTIEIGDKIILSGTIKAHTEFRGILQTQLSRCIVKKGE